MDTIKHTILLATTHLEDGHPLTIRTLATHLGCSIGTAHAIVNSLTQRGLLTRHGPTHTITPTETGLILIDRI